MGVPTGVLLTTLAVPAGACVTLCIDASNKNSNVEDMNGGMYDVLFVYGAEISPYNPCEGCSYVDGGGDAGDHPAGTTSAVAVAAATASTGSLI